MKLRKKENWRSELALEIESRVGAKFSYGSHDCCVAISRCIKAMTGDDLKKEFPSYRGRKNGEALLEEEGGLDKLVERMGKRYDFEEIELPYAQTGDVVIHNRGEDNSLGLGIVGSPANIFFSPVQPKGWAVLRVEDALRAWRVCDG